MITSVVYTSPISVETVNKLDDDDDLVEPMLSLVAPHPSVDNDEDDEDDLGCYECTLPLLSTVKRENVTDDVEVMVCDDDVFFDSYDDLPDDLLFEDVICASEDLLFDPLPTVEDQFQDCYETSPSCFEFKGHRFYDPEVEPDVLTFMVNAPPGASYFLLIMFWFTMLFWDTIGYLLSGLVHHETRKQRRSRHRLTMAFLPRKWLVFSNTIMLLGSVLSGQLPFLTLSESYRTISLMSEDVFGRIWRLNDMVALNCWTLHHYNHIKAQHLVDSLEPSEKTPILPTISTALSREEEQLFFNSYKEHIKAPMQYFDAFFDEEDITLFDAFTEFDPFQFHILATNSHMIDCVFESANKALNLIKTDLLANGPSIQALASLMELEAIVNDLQVFKALGGHKKSVIFNTGASLVISFDKSDFDGPIKPSEGDLRLGGMAGGLKIEGYGPVTWGFANKDGSEIQIWTQCYYVPQAHNFSI